jgi:hypothetical protein
MFEQEMGMVTKIVNIIISHALSNWQFKILLDEVNSQYCRLLMCNIVL